MKNNFKKEILDKAKYISFSCDEFKNYLFIRSKEKTIEMEELKEEKEESEERIEDIVEYLESSEDFLKVSCPETSRKRFLKKEGLKKIKFLLIRHISFKEILTDPNRDEFLLIKFSYKDRDSVFVPLLPTRKMDFLFFRAVYENYRNIIEPKGFIDFYLQMDDSGFNGWL